nr:hypothetical protein [Methylobacterium sp. E-065]
MPPSTISIERHPEAPPHGAFGIANGCDGVLSTGAIAQALRDPDHDPQRLRTRCIQVRQFVSVFVMSDFSPIVQGDEETRHQAARRMLGTPSYAGSTP